MSLRMHEADFSFKDQLVKLFREHVHASVRLTISLQSRPNMPAVELSSRISGEVHPPPITPSGFNNEELRSGLFSVVI